MEIPLGVMKGFIETRYGLGMSQVNEAREKEVKDNGIYIHAVFIF